MGIRSYPEQKTQSVSYSGSNVNRSTKEFRFPFGSLQNPASSASQLVSNGITTNGNYYVKPSGYSGSAIQTYINFSNAPTGKGYILVARGRESTDWWNTSGQNFTTGLLEANLSVNTAIAVAPDTFVNNLIGGNWNSMKMLTNRINNSDSFYIEGTTSSTFSWARFNEDPSSINSTITRYNSQWKGGGSSYTTTNTNRWTDTLNYGASNDCTRTFTWTWSSHGGYQGWSGGQSCTPAGSFQASGEGHAIQLVNVYIEC